ncbi:unnamed protein product [Parnassius apollo]|uniref:(apollo) hypothetical protein n=1 Tax=Parnassius apollo TaxID=110799 RepID=A0A8S3XAB3_PARAO|nr:unnamed protein product [Parnassius apollo]
MDTELLEKAETLLLKRSQDNSFREDIKRLQQGKQLEGSSKLKRLDVVLEEGLLRLKGRIDAIQAMNDENIADALNESKFDYSGDDSDCDLTFKPPELDCHVVAIGANDSDTDITDSDDSDNATESDYPAPSPTLSK